MSDNVRAHVIISGRVQGVFFRMETKRTADAAGVSGWVRNLADGTVEAVFEGARGDVDTVLEWCHQGPSAALVKSVALDWQFFSAEFDRFTVTG